MGKSKNISNKSSTGSSNDFQLVKYKRKKHHFEVLVKPGVMEEYRKGNLSIDKVLYSDIIYKNFHKSDQADSESLLAAFESDNIKKCCAIILAKGEYHLTTEQRRAKIVQKKLEIVNFIHKYYTDPSTRKPHPVKRIELGVDNIKFNVDVNESVQQQVMTIVPKLIDNGIPLKKSTISGVLKIPHKLLGSTGGAVSKWCEVQREKYDSHGCIRQISVVPGDFDDFMKELQHITKGDFDFTVDGTQTVKAQPKKLTKKQIKAAKRKAKRK